MSSTINLKMNSECGNAAVHLMPCNIDYNGPANVERYFTSCNKNLDEEDCLQGSFRGRCVMGKTVKIPSGFKGVVVTEKNSVCSDHQERKIEVTKDFDEMTYWNLETRPSQNDALMNAFDWVNVASILHAPITKDETVEEEKPIKSTSPER